MMDTGIKTERHDSQRNAAFHGLGWIIIYMCKSVREKRELNLLEHCLCVCVCMCVSLSVCSCICLRVYVYVFANLSV